MRSRRVRSRRNRCGPHSRKGIQMMLQDRLRKTAVVAASSARDDAGRCCVTLRPARRRRLHGDRTGMAEPGDMIGHLIAGAKDQLNLNTSQQQMFDACCREHEDRASDGSVAAPDGQGRAHRRAREERAGPRRRGCGVRQRAGPGSGAAQVGLGRSGSRSMRRSRQIRRRS